MSPDPVYVQNQIRSSPSSWRLHLAGPRGTLTFLPNVPETFHPGDCGEPLT
jgi:hypothetical protein